MLSLTIYAQADHALTGQANERDQKRLEKTLSDRSYVYVVTFCSSSCQSKLRPSKLENQIRRIEVRLNQPTASAISVRLRAEVANYRAQIDSLNTDIEQIQERITERQQELQEDAQAEISGNSRLPNESQRDFLIRTGKITPFSKLPGTSLNRVGTTLQDVLLNAEEDQPEEEAEVEVSITDGPVSHRNLLQPGFSDDIVSGSTSAAEDLSDRPTKRRRTSNRSEGHGDSVDDIEGSSGRPPRRKTAIQMPSDDTDANTFATESDEDESAELGSLENQSNLSDEDAFPIDTPGSKRKATSQNNKNTRKEHPKEDYTGLDDGNETLYQFRLQSWVKRRSTARQKAKARGLSDDDTATQLPCASEPGNQQLGGIGQNVNLPENDADEWNLPHPIVPDTSFEGGFRMPGDIYPSLFDYQKTGVRWLWELYSQQAGGIIGDEMGLGKTIQAIAFLAGLHYSKKITKPIIVVAPATVLKQWVNEFHTWWPPFRVSILHTSGSGMVDVGRESRREDELSAQMFNPLRRKPPSKSQKAAKRIVDRVVQNGHVLVTTYSGLQTYAELLLPVEWEHAILDEGHKIRNPNTAITIYCKELRTANRIILSGTPMQNNLVELWSLFDFVFPMRLGTLVNFRQQFEFPIRQGGYANASNLQVQIASKCAETLKSTISPYLLQRFKVDVAADLPKKTEQVLFCKLTKLQREAYETFLDSDDMNSIMNGKRQVLYGVDMLRKICNHPDLQEHKVLSIKPGYNYGSGAKSGKMVIVKELLDVWKKGGHKTLLFAQHRIMLDILEKYIKGMSGMNYRRMDGNTPIASRQAMVDEFNTNPDAHVFLLTTKVGGLGINLTGADRVIIYDPDWNPSTDVQARERAWRLGQKREVQIYRLMVAGTIEEKILHRQIFKTFLTNKILKDPKQRQTFQLKDLHDLFTLGHSEEETTETGRLFKGTEVIFGDDSVKATSTTNEHGSNIEDSSAQSQSGDQQSLRAISGVAAIEPVVEEIDAANNNVQSANTTNSEARIMEGIFARSGVLSALEHDQIINGKKILTADPRIIEREAKRVAAEAANELKKAGEIAKSVPVGTPTWTGQFGTAGRPNSTRRGPASSSLLAGLRHRQASNGMANGSPSSSVPANIGTSSLGGKDFMRMIRDYLVAHGGKAYTQMLIDHFNRHCPTPAKTEEFKAMLREIATLQKGSRGRGAWILKEEYRAAS